MYEKFYGLREKPFALRPDARFLYLAKHHMRALLLMEYGLVNDASFLLITGEIGAGKTTLIRCLLERLDESLVVGLVSHTSRESGRLLQWVCLAFGLEVKGKEDVELYDDLVHFLIEVYAQGKRAVLIVDEAQNLGRTRLEELRLLSNLNADQDFLLQMILVGQPELRDLMRTPQLAQLAQRIGADYHIGGLTPARPWPTCSTGSRWRAARRSSSRRRPCDSRTPRAAASRGSSTSSATRRWCMPTRSRSRGGRAADARGDQGSHAGRHLPRCARHWSHDSSGRTSSYRSCARRRWGC
jgi:type II secretory pathway predicted ATPase ExeA